MPEGIREVYWAPEGQFLAMATNSGAFLAQGSAFQVQQVVSFTESLTQDFGDQILSWSPDGSYLAIQDNTKLWVIEAASGKIDAEIPLTVQEKWYWPGVHMSWAPDGKSLFYSDRSGLYRWDQAAGLRLFFDTPEPADQIFWSPSGRYLAFTTHQNFDSGGFGVHILDLQGSVICGWSIDKGWAGTLSGWLGNEAVAWENHCGTGCAFMSVLDISSCQETLSTGFGAHYQWRSAGDYASVMYIPREDQAYLLSRAGLCTNLARPSEPAFDCTFKTWETTGLQFPPFDPNFHYPLAWSPDEQQLLLARLDSTWVPEDSPYQVLPTRTCDLGIVTVPALTYTHLLSDTCYGEWSPDGQLVSFVATGKPILDEQGRMVGAAAEALPSPTEAYLGVLDLQSRRVQVMLPFPFTPAFEGRQRQPDFWDYNHGVTWSPDSRYLLAVDGNGILSLWRRGDAQATIIYHHVQADEDSLDETFSLQRWSADSRAFFFQSGNRAWVARVRR